MNPNLPTSESDSPFGNYFGSEFSSQQCELIFLGSEIPLSFAQNENALMNVKWFDYRDMHYVKATYLFAKFYRQAYQRMTEKVIDFERAPFVKGYKGKDIFKLSTREYKGFWKARFAADKLGIPYDFYTTFALNWTNNRLWKRFPRPTQIYSKILLTDMLESWADTKSSKIQTPIDGRFYLSNYAGHQDQDAFQVWMCNEIKTKTNPEMALATYMYLTPMITRKHAEEHFDRDMINKADKFYCLIK